MLSLCFSKMVTIFSVNKFFKVFKGSWELVDRMLHSERPQG